MGKAIRAAYGEAVTKIGATNDKIIVLDADLSGATQTKLFKKEFPDRFYNVGIAEENLMGVAAGLAYQGFIPFASTFAVFGTGRAFEIVRNQIAYVNLNVKLALTHAGISVGEDGGSHQSIEDIALMRALPNMTVIVPCDAIETEKAVKAAAEYVGPVYLRLARPVVEDVTKVEDKFEIGKAQVLKDGKDACIIACGLMVQKALDAANELTKNGIDTAVINMHTIKPLDKETILKFNEKCKVIVTAEEHSVIGGLGSAVAEVIAGKNGAKFAMVGVEDKFGHSGNPEKLFEEYGLTKDNIIKKVKENV